MSELASASLGGFFGDLVDAASLKKILLVLSVLALGYLAVRICLALIRRIGRPKLTARALDVLEKLVKYGGATVVIVNASKLAGIDLSAILGAAGIVGIAIGFAAQTSVSNIISGLFLFSEKAFEVGDVIQLDAVSGVVESVDMLSVKIRTFDNRLVRVPNETMIKSNIVNVTHWPERRMDLKLVLPYGADPEIAEALLKDAAMSVPSALSDPEPFFLVGDMTPSGLSLTFGVWFKKDDYSALRNALVPAVLRKLESQGIRPAPELLSVSLTAPQAVPPVAPRAAPRAAPKAATRAAKGEGRAPSGGAKKPRRP